MYRNLRQIGLGLIMYSNENNETFPSDTTAMTALNKLYPDYVSERKAFKCPSDNLVTDAENANITAGDAFEKDECSYGYDRTHTPADDPGVAIRETGLQIILPIIPKIRNLQIMVVTLVLLVLAMLKVTGKIWFILMVTWNELYLRMQATWMRLAIETTSM